jgi:hypothetical protein
MPHHRGHFYRAQRIQSGSGPALPGDVGYLLGPRQAPEEQAVQQAPPTSAEQGRMLCRGWLPVLLT